MQKITGKNLKRLREAKGWTQKDLATATGTLTPQISAIENGKRGIGKSLMLKFVKALGCDPSDFYTSIDEVHHERRQPVNYLKRALIMRVLRAMDEVNSDGELELIVKIERILREKEQSKKTAV